MATYPTLPTAFKSDPEPIPSIAIDRSEDGTARGRELGADKVRFKVVHNWLTAAQKATLDAFYSANRLLPFDYTSPTNGAAYVCLFAKAIKYERLEGDYYIATVEMEEV